MHVVWHKEPDASQMGYYAQFAFYFQTGSVGYMGLQKDSQSGKKAIFSIWDSQGLVCTTATMQSMALVTL